jgi:hypothetical protein
MMPVMIAVLLAAIGLSPERIAIDEAAQARRGRGGHGG